MITFHGVSVTNKSFMIFGTKIRQSLILYFYLLDLYARLKNHVQIFITWKAVTGKNGGNLENL